MIKYLQFSLMLAENIPGDNRLVPSELPVRFLPL